MEEIKCKQVGQILGSGFTEMTGRVYSPDGLSPSIRTFAGGNTEVKIVDDMYNNREIRVYDDCPTIRAERQGLKVMEPIVWDGFNQQIRTDSSICGTITGNVGKDPKRNGQAIIEPIAYDEQNGYLRQDCCVGTLTTDGSTPKHNNRIIEPAEQYIGCAVHPLSKKLEFDGYKDTVCPTLLATDYKCPKTVAFRVTNPRIAAMRGRNPDNPSDRTAGCPTKQRIEIGSEKTSNTLTTVQKDNLVVEQSRGGGTQCIRTAVFVNLPRAKLIALWASIIPTLTTPLTVAYRRQTTAND